MAEYGHKREQSDVNAPRITIQFDGGCSPNPGNMYGSFAILINGQEACSANRFPLGHGTNNEAEFNALIQGIHKALECLQLAGLTASEFEAHLITDSTIVRNRINGTRRDTPKQLRRAEKRYGSKSLKAAERMRNLAAQCFEPLAKFKSFTIEWQSREVNVERFGH